MTRLALKDNFDQFPQMKKKQTKTNIQHNKPQN